MTTKPKHFMVYFPEATSAGDKHMSVLKGMFGDNRVYQLNGSGAFVVKVNPDSDYQSVMDKIGFNEKEKRTGVLIQFDNTNVNGWYSQALWSFISQELSDAR